MSTSAPLSASGPRRRDLTARLSDLTLRDAFRLRRRIDRSRTPSDLQKIAAEIERAEMTVINRRTSVPRISYPETLPVSARKDDIAAAIAANQVVIVAGETGSGKTTQIPKICLELGRGIQGVIGHTQPRRLAARTVAERIAEELGQEIGDAVGYTVRFTDQSGDNTLVKLMTDGILLAEIQRDRMLRRYDTIIIDEAHERSLNIDFILGYLARLLPQRPDLKVIVTSATIDPGRFARHFAANGVDAPVVEVSGRTFPVEVRYRPLTVEVGDETIDLDPVDATCDAVEELLREPEGDVLVFLSGEREIRDTADALKDRRLRNVEILPLYARLSAAEQHRVFTRHTGRRVVLSTNVAETSLTVPGIRYVVDPGTARISRYSVRTKVQRLPIEPISQASARQRAGRCGRVADGICIRLYSEEDFDARPEYTDPEILRTNLASVILQMASLGLGRIDAFPFVEAPDPRSIRDGLGLLDELGALESQGDDGPVLTPLGRELAGLPVDPRMARMLVEANRNGCLREVLVIVAALSIQDVRERPAEHQQAADEMHKRFVVDGSDFLALWELWTYLGEKRHELSSNQFRRMCKSEFLHYLRIREWQDLHGQLRQITRGLGWTVPDGQSDAPPNEATIHQALLSGLLSHIGLREGDKRDFQGARGSSFAVFPGSSLFKKPPRWIMAAELVETSRLWARMGARIEPEWAEKLAPHLIKRQYSEPHWSTKREVAMAYERVTLYGIPLAARRPVTFGSIDAEVSRDLFIRHALVQGEWRTHHRFFHHNQEMRSDAEELESRARRRDIVVDDDTLFAFYDERIPATIVSARHFDRWWKKTSKAAPDLLDFDRTTVVNPDAAAVLGGDYPDAWRQGELQFPLSYQFEPGKDDDGVTVTIPIAVLPQVADVGFEWLVPGMRVELVTALIKTLPKDLRRNVVPAPDHAVAAVAAMRPRTEPLLSALARELTRMGAVPITAGDFHPETLPRHLKMTFVVTDDRGKPLGKDTSLSALRTRLGAAAAKAVGAAAKDSEKGPVTRWTSETIGILPETVTRTVNSQKVTGYPALVPEKGGVAVRVLGSPEQQRAAMREGTRRLLLDAIPVNTRALLTGRSPAQRLALGQNPHGSIDAFVDDCRTLAADDLMTEHGGPVTTPEAYAALEKSVRSALAGRTASILRAAEPSLAAAARVRLALDDARGDAADDVRQQLDALIFPGFVFETGTTHLPHLPRYLRAAELRLRALPSSASRDAVGMDALDRVYADYDALLSAVPESVARSEAVRGIAWSIEELRVNLFAQTVGTAYPVSEKRVRKTIADVRRAAGR